MACASFRRQCSGVGADDDDGDDAQASHSPLCASGLVLWEQEERRDEMREDGTEVAATAAAEAAAKAVEG